MHIYCLLPETKNLVCRNYRICGRANTVRLCSPDFNTTRSTQTQEQQVLRRNGQNRQHSATCQNYEPQRRGRRLVPCGATTASESSAVCTYRCKVRRNLVNDNTPCCSHVQIVNMWQPVSSMSAQSSYSCRYKNRGLRPKLNPVFLKACSLAQNTIKDAN